MTTGSTGQWPLREETMKWVLQLPLVSSWKQVPGLGPRGRKISTVGWFHWVEGTKKEFRKAKRLKFAEQSTKDEGSMQRKSSRYLSRNRFGSLALH